jgi:ADP-ribosyl-[dinitrogen reductase] hydrolase
LLNQAEQPFSVLPLHFILPSCILLVSLTTMLTRISRWFSRRSLPADLRQRYAGALLGLAAGDAVGTTVEFRRRGSFARVTDMTGGGPFNLAAGQWTDDTSMALCLAESLLAKSGFDARDQMGRYLNWWRWGYLSSTGTCFDIGNTVSAALSRFEASDDPYSGSTDAMTAGNGSLMRLVPVVLYYFPVSEDVDHYAAESSRTTHAAPEAIECCRLFAHIVSNALGGVDKQALLDGSAIELHEPNVQNLASRIYLTKSIEQIRGTGYAVASLEAALWCFHHTTSFESAVLQAANLGEDADTTAAIVGQLAGAFYGLEGIPAHWRQRLHMAGEIISYADRLFDAARAR